MKKLYLFISLVIFSFSIKAQQFQDNAPCINGNPNGSGYIDWTAQYFTIHTISLGTTTIPSPFYLNSLNNPNVNEFSKYAEKDFNNSKGWELWKYDFGTSTVRNDVPYLILYNRHTGLMRIFLAFAKLYGQNNGISVELKYEEQAYRSAILENYNRLDNRHATKNFSNNVPEIKNNNYYINSVLTWYHSDFYLHYDPCICNYENNIVLEVKLSNQGNINFEIKGQALQNFQTGISTDGHGRIGEKGVFSVLNDNDFKAIPFFKEVTSGLSFGKKLVNSDWLNLKPEVKTKYSAFLGSLSANLPIVGAFANLLISIFDGSGTSAPMPLVFDINLDGSGSIVYSSNYLNNTLVVPGSEQTLLFTQILPYYNKPVGIFTFITEPVIEYNDEVIYADDWGQPERYETTTMEAYKLKNEDFQFIINPHAGFDISQSEIKGALIFEGPAGERIETELYDLGCLKYIKKSFYHYISQSSDEPSWNYEEGWTPISVALKIVAKFKVAGTDLQVPYIGTYFLNKQYNFNVGNPSAEESPSPGCNLTMSEATSSQIKSVCNSQIYKDKVTEYTRWLPDPGKDSSKIDHDRKENLKVFPNPFYEQLNISLGKGIAFPVVKIQLIDQYGRTVFTNEYQNSSGDFVLKGLSALANGIYYLKISSEKGQLFSIKVLKIK